MDIFDSEGDVENLRLTLDFLRDLSEDTLSPFDRRNSLVLKLSAILQLRLISLISSIGLILYLGFTMQLSPILISLAVLLIAILVLRLKFRMIRLSKAYKAKEPPLEVGEIVVSRFKSRLQFYLVKKKSVFHIYLVPLKQTDIYDILEHGKNQNDSPTNENTLLVHKKRVFNNFYKVTAYHRRRSTSRISA